MTDILVSRELIDSTIKLLENNTAYVQSSYDEQPEPASEWDFNAGMLAAELRGALDAKPVEPVAALKWRPEVTIFADAMESKLRKNDWKAPWQGMGMQYLSMRLTQEREELRRAVGAGDPDEVLHEAADVANFAMMIADHVRRHPGVSRVTASPNISNDLDQAQKRIAELEAQRDEARECMRAWAGQCEALTAENEKLRAQYNELIMAVARKYQDETRHETALRYIIEREAPKHNEIGCDAAKDGEGPC